MKSRVRVIVLSLALLLSTLVLTNVNMVKAYADGDKTIRFHYTRSDGDYDKWTMWVWPDQQDGKGYDFVVAADGNEAVATYTCSSETAKVGFIVKGKTDWSKDVNDDREIDLSAISADVVDVYITSGEKEFRTEAADANTQTESPDESSMAEGTTTVAAQATETESDDPNADYSASIGTVIVADVVLLLVVAALCFTVFGKKKDTMF